jgi:hypothetical protein
MGKMSRISIENQRKLQMGPGIIMTGIGGDTIMVDDNYIVSTVNAMNTNSGVLNSPQKKVVQGEGIDIIDNGTSETIRIQPWYIDDKIEEKIHEVNKTKPIFIFGLPQFYDTEMLRDASEALQHRMGEYHVLCIKNQTDDYSAKIYSVEGITPVGIDEIKKYIDFKTKK